MREAAKNPESPKAFAGFFGVFRYGKGRVNRENVSFKANFLYTKV